MPTYRLFPVAGARIAGPGVDVECDNESVALLEAGRLLSHSEGVEIWQGPKLVRRLPGLNDNQALLSLRANSRSA
jgi:hypothetical protein